MVEGEEEPKELTPVERAEKAVKDMDERLEKLTEVMNKTQEASARMMLGGRGDVTSEEKPKEETAAEYRDRVMSGGLNEKRED